MEVANLRTTYSERCKTIFHDPWTESHEEFSKLRASIRCRLGHHFPTAAMLTSVIDERLQILIFSSWSHRCPVALSSVIFSQEVCVISRRWEHPSAIGDVLLSVTRSLKEGRCCKDENTNVLYLIMLYQLFFCHLNLDCEVQDNLATLILVPRLLQSPAKASQSQAVLIAVQMPTPRRQLSSQVTQYCWAEDI
jgi:hypothetical protein